MGTCRQSLALQLWFGAAVEHDFAAEFESISTDRNPVLFLTGLLTGFKTGVALRVLLGQPSASDHLQLFPFVLVDPLFDVPASIG